MNFFWVKLFSPDILMYRPSWISCYMKIGWFFNLGPHPIDHIKPDHNVDDDDDSGDEDDDGGDEDDDDDENDNSVWGSRLWVQ